MNENIKAGDRVTVDVMITGVFACREDDGFLRINVGPATAVIDDKASNVTVTEAGTVQEPTEAQVEAVTDALEPHWRTDCSDSPIGGPYVRWVKCRCGWESPKSETEVRIPDLHRIWNGHVARAALLAAREASK